MIHAPREIIDKIISMPHSSDDEYIFQFAPGGIYKRLQSALSANGVQHISFHDLRHMNASIMVALGVPDKYAMERGGWSSNSTLQNVYQHTFSEERKQIDQKIDDYFRGIL